MHPDFAPNPRAGGVLYEPGRLSPYGPAPDPERHLGRADLYASKKQTCNDQHEQSAHRLTLF